MFVVFLVVLTIAMVALSIALTVLYVDPLKSVERTGTEWFGATLLTQEVSEGVPPFHALFHLTGNSLCGPSNALGNETLSLVWQSTSMNTTAELFWVSGNPLNLTFHPVYWVNGTSWGGLAFPPGLQSFLCHQGLVYFDWDTPLPAQITLSGVWTYNYAASAPIW